MFAGASRIDNRLVLRNAIQGEYFISDLIYSHELPAGTIDDVIADMERVITRCSEESSRLGYFAALYYDVTVKVRAAILAGSFEDGKRMERLDIVFARRYLDAIGQFWRGEEPTLSWQMAFRSARRWSPTILQHLLLGMNAHINLDLAIAAAQIAPGEQLPGLERDFMKISDILTAMIWDVQERIDDVSPWIGLIDKVGGRTNEMILAFAIAQARQMAWAAALALNASGPDRVTREIGRLDALISTIGGNIRAPGLLLNLVLLVIRLRETKKVPAIIAALRM